MKHIKYWTYLLLAFIITQFIIVSVMMIPIGWILFLIYAWCTWYLWWKAYNWKDVNIEYIDDFEKKIKDNLNDDRIVKKEDNITSPQPSPQEEGIKGEIEKEDDETKF
jgi:c-di-AMP phosphodiesterase-like protein